MYSTGFCASERNNNSTRVRKQKELIQDPLSYSAKILFRCNNQSSNLLITLIRKYIYVSERGLVSTDIKFARCKIRPESVPDSFRCPNLYATYNYS